MPGIPPGQVCPSTGSTVSVSMTQGADLETLHLTLSALTFFVQHSSAPPGRPEHPDPPHRPQSAGQQTPEALYPVRPLEHVWAVVVVVGVGGVFRRGADTGQAEQERGNQ